MAYLIGGGGGASLPTSTTGSYDFLVPNLTGGWQKANRVLTGVDYNADEWTEVDTSDASSTTSVTQSGSAVILEIDSPTSATVQGFAIKKALDMPNVLVYGHLACSHGFFLQVYPAAGYTRTLDSMSKGGSTAQTYYGSTRDGSTTNTYMGTLNPATTGLWWSFRKTSDAMGFTWRTLNTAVSPYIDLEDFQNFVGSAIKENPSGYTHRAGSTGVYDSLTQKYELYLGVQTPASTGTYTATFSHVEIFPL